MSEILIGEVAARVRLRHKRRNDFVRTWTLKDEDTGNPLDFGATPSARMVFKSKFDDKNTAGEPLIEWSTATGEISLPGSGQVVFNGPAADMNPPWERAVFELEITYDSGRIWSPVYGPFELVASAALPTP